MNTSYKDENLKNLSDNQYLSELKINASNSFVKETENITFPQNLNTSNLKSVESKGQTPLFTFNPKTQDQFDDDEVSSNTAIKISNLNILGAENFFQNKSGNNKFDEELKDDDFQQASHETGFRKFFELISNGISSFFIFERLKSFTILISLVQIVLYIITFYFTDNNDRSLCLMYFSGAKFTPAIVLYKEYYRLVMPLFLHGSLTHLIFNLISQLLMGLQLENEYNNAKVAFLYIVSGIGGNLFSCIFSPFEMVSIGASTSIYGLFGLWICWEISQSNNMGTERYYMLAIDALCILINLVLIPIFVENIDYSAHNGI